MQILPLGFPAVGLLILPQFDRDSPLAFGLPLFDWWLALWIPVSLLCLGLCWFMARVARR
jgi:hypothetical protein